jgi:hypothetical protein
MQSIVIMKDNQSSDSDGFTHFLPPHYEKLVSAMPYVGLDVCTYAGMWTSLAFEESDGLYSH